MEAKDLFTKESTSKLAKPRFMTKRMRLKSFYATQELHNENKSSDIDECDVI